MTATASEVISHRYDFVLLYDVTNGNPNGDPDAGNAPRIDPETGHGLVSDVCLKRKIRDYVTLAKAGDGKPEEGHDIYVKIHGVLGAEHQRAYESLGLKDGEKGAKLASNAEKARAWMCQTFYDVRTFGAVMSLKEFNCGQVRGPVQIAFSRSIDPIVSLEQTITRKAVATVKEAEGQIEKHGSVTGTMGRKEVVPYALYRAHGFVSPFLAADTGFTNDDLDLLWQALMMMFEQDHSANRGEMTTRKLVVFEHESKLGNAPSHVLFDGVSIDRKSEDKPPRSFSDYTVAVNKEGVPSGITVHEKL